MIHTQMWEGQSKFSTHASLFRNTSRGREVPTRMHKEACAKMLKTKRFIIVKNWGQSKCPLWGSTLWNVRQQLIRMEEIFTYEHGEIQDLLEWERRMIFLSNLQNNKMFLYKKKKTRKYIYVCKNEEKNDLERRTPNL